MIQAVHLILSQMRNIYNVVDKSTTDSRKNSTRPF